MSWSGGKDCAWALHRVRQTTDIEVAGLLTTVDGVEGRVGMHRVPRALIEAQAEALDLPLAVVPLPWPCPNAAYEAAIDEALRHAVQTQGIEAIAFGDLYLADIRRYREGLMRQVGLEPLFPLWDEPTGPLAREMMDSGLQARVVCVDTSFLPDSYAGRQWDHDFLAELPPDVDPCGENGEFHTFAWDGPPFRRPIRHRVGETVWRDGFLYTELGELPEICHNRRTHEP